MGNQQIILFILVLILVTAAISFGISMFLSGNAESNRNALISDGTNLTAKAWEYFRKPKSLGGGGGSFTGWWTKLPKKLKQSKNGSLTIDEKPETIKLLATGTAEGWNDSAKVLVAITITPDSLQTLVLN
ncbi:MAG: hypothetical protein C4539_19860 [Ignavibacteriales bacterium]|nr:MAG: hypothetical protein C4539_19860 [Ignavibacteriales bacterium]